MSINPKKYGADDKKQLCKARTYDKSAISSLIGGYESGMDAHFKGFFGAVYGGRL